MMRVCSLVAMISMFGSLASAQDLASKGKDVYAAQKCNVCHAIAGTGNKKGALDGIAGKLSADELRTWLTDAPAMAAKIKSDRKPPMKAYTLAKDDLDALVAYLQTLK